MGLDAAAAGSLVRAAVIGGDYSSNAGRGLRIASTRDTRVIGATAMVSIGIDPAAATIAGAQLLHALSRAPPIDRRGRGVPADVRLRAYVEMQRATWSAVNYLGQVRVMTPYYAQPIKGSWYFPHALRTANKMAGTTPRTRVSRSPPPSKI